MRCLVCNTKMIVMNVVGDDTMPVHGFEWRTFMCAACGDTERRLVFARHAGEGAPEAMQMAPSTAVEQTDNEPLPGKSEPAPMRVEPPLADERTDNEPGLGDVLVAPIAPASAAQDERAVASGLIRRVMAKVRGW
jgi:hypothetical protein